MEKNLLAEKIIAALRTRDTHTHRNVMFITVNEDAIRFLFESDEYLKELSAKEHDALEEQMNAAQAARQKAEAADRKRLQDAKVQAEKMKQKRIDSKLAQEKQVEEQRRQRKEDARQAKAAGTDNQKTMTFHAKSNNMQRAAGEQKKRGPAPFAKPIKKKDK